MSKIFSHDYDATAALAVLSNPHKSIEQIASERGRPRLIQAVRSRGVDMHIIHGQQSIDLDTGVAQVGRPEFHDGIPTMTNLGERALSSYGVIRNLLRPSDPTIDTFTTVVNPTNLRLLGRDKNKIGQTILAPLGLYRQSYLHTPDKPFRLSNIDFARELVVKPNTGFGSRGIGKGTPEEIFNALDQSSAPFLIEERLSFTPPLPVRGRDEKEQARLDDANERGLNKELRMYSFGDDDWYTVGRVAYQHELKMSGEEWIFLDEQSVPDVAYAITSQVKSRVDRETNTADTLLAVDLVYVTSSSNPEPHWEVMEVNAEHYIVRSNVDKTTGEKFRSLLADHIVRRATNTHT